jgi:predicted dehydrogenase
VIAVALLGGGFMGEVHASAYRSLAGRARVKTLFSRGSERSREVAASLGARLVEDLDEAVSDPEVAAVDICLPSYLHRVAAEKSFAAGRDVLLEKPIALTLEDADQIIEAAARAGRTLMVGLVLRFWPEYAEMQRIIAASEIGRARAVSTYRLSPPATWNSWMGDESLSGGVPVDLLVHDLDQMNLLLGRPLQVFARSPVPGHVMATVEYEDGKCGFAEASMVMPSTYAFTSSIRVLCDKGAAEYQFVTTPVNEQGNISSPQQALKLNIYPPVGQARVASVAWTDPWEAEIAYFLECLESKRAPEKGTGQQARAALSLSLAINRALRTGRAEAL